MKSKHVRSVLITSVLCFSYNAHSQSQLPINSDNLSFFEEPLANQVGGFTFLLNGILDFSIQHDFDLDDSDEDFTGLFQISTERQFENALTIGATYIGTEEEGYEGNFAAYVRGVWGRLSIGEVTSLTREATRRVRGVGNAELNFDDTYGDFENQGIAYSLRLSQMTLNTMIDESGNFDAGITYDRPLGNKDYRFTTRVSDNEFETSNGEILDSKGIKVVGELIYGSLLSDIGIGYERLDGSGINADRYYVSSGLRYKRGRWNGSVEGLYGEIEGQSERSIALGLRYDIARGFSTNLGVNLIDSQVNIDGLQLQDQDTTELILSIRYEF